MYRIKKKDVYGKDLSKRRIEYGCWIKINEDSVAEWSKAIDLKSIILWMRRFKSCHCRFFKVFKFLYTLYIY